MYYHDFSNSKPRQQDSGEIYVLFKVDQQKLILAEEVFNVNKNSKVIVEIILLQILPK